MKKNCAFFRSRLVFILMATLSFKSTVSFGQQSICGSIVEDFQNTAGSTAGFTGDFIYGFNGINGYLVRNNVIASAIYVITTPTYTLANNANFVGYGFILDGTQKVARVEVSVIYTSTLTNQTTTLFLGQFVPPYSTGIPEVAEICRAVSFSDLPGFPPGGKYRFRLELTPNTGTGQALQNITFDDFRTNGTLSLATLPVAIFGFDARKVNNNILLAWKVAGEENVSHYEVERSEDGRNFTRIATIARNGKDTYSYTDVNTSNTVYYRIRNINNDGNFKYSPVARIANGRTAIMLKAFPLPVQDRLTLQHSTISGKALVKISTADGRVVRTIVPAPGSMQTGIDMAGLQKGIYIINFDEGDGNLQTLKIVKQ